MLRSVPSDDAARRPTGLSRVQDTWASLALAGYEGRRVKEVGREERGDGSVGYVNDVVAWAWWLREETSSLAGLAPSHCRYVGPQVFAGHPTPQKCTSHSTTPVRKRTADDWRRDSHMLHIIRCKMARLIGAPSLGAMERVALTAPVFTTSFSARSPCESGIVPVSV